MWAYPETNSPEFTRQPITLGSSLICTRQGVEFALAFFGKFALKCGVFPIFEIAPSALAIWACPPLAFFIFLQAVTFVDRIRAPALSTIDLGEFNLNINSV